MGFMDAFRREKLPVEKAKPSVEEGVAFDSFVAGIQEYIVKTISWSKVFGTGRSLSSITDNPYKKISSVYKPVKAIIDNVPQAKLVLYNLAGEMVTNKILAERFDQPSPGVSYNDFIGGICAYLALNGEAFIIIDAKTIGEQSGSKLPSLLVVNPKDVSEIVDKDTKALLGWRVGTKEYKVEEVIVIKDFNPDNPNRGLSPSEPLALEMAIDYFSLMYNKKFFENDASPGITLETDQGLSEEQKAQLREAWDSGSRGVKNAFKTRLLEGGLKVKQTVQSHKDMDFIEQKKLVRDEITGNWRVPKSMFNVTDSINYATFQGQMKMFWQYQVVPMLRKVEDSLNMGYMKKYGKGLKLGFDFKNVPAFAEDIKDKVTSAQMLYNMGFTRNEINEELELGFEEKPWGDEWWVNAGMTPASLLIDGAVEEEDGDGDQDASDLDDSIDKAFIESADVKAMKGFLKKHEVLETKLAGRVRKHLYNIRNSIINLPDSVLGDKKLDINWEKANQEIITLTAPVITEAVKQGIESAKEDVSKQAPDIIEKTGISDTETMLNSYLALRVDKITGINRTIRKMLLSKIERAVKDGIITGSTMTEIAQGVRVVTRDFFNLSGARAKLIARTEVTGAMNGGSLAYYKEIGCDKKRWLTANDELVRETHRHCEDQGWIDIDEAFTNDLQNPGDQDANKVGEVANCRCKLLGKL